MMLFQTTALTFLLGLPAAASASGTQPSSRGASMETASESIGGAGEYATPIWVTKLQVKPGTGSSDGAWKASLLLNADRRAAALFDRFEDELEVSLGASTILVPTGSFILAGSKHSYALRNGSYSIRVGYDRATERITVDANGIVWTDVLPATLDLRVRIGDQSQVLRLHVDESGRFLGPADLRSRSFAVSKFALRREESGTGTLALDAFLGDAALTFDPLSDELRVRLLHDGTPLLDRELSEGAVVRSKFDPQSGTEVFQISTPVEAAGPNACTGLRYDGAKGRLRFGFQEVDLASLPAGPNPVHLTVEMTLGVQVFDVDATLFEQAPGSYSLRGNGGGISFRTTSVPDAEVGQAYAAEVAVAGGAGLYTWSVAGGALPPGLVLEGATGRTAALSGLPTLAGVFEFTVEAESGGYTAAQRFRIDVEPNAPSLGGWTQFEPVTGARTIYVSTAGNDAADGSASSPRRTLAGGFALLRDGYADWLLLRRGDTFALDAPFQWTKSGPSSGTGWMRLGAYGDVQLPRPVLLSRGGFLAITPGYQSTSTIRRLAVTDIFLSAADRLANSATTTSNLNGLQLLAVQWQGTGKPFSDLLFENCRVSGFTTGFASGEDVENLSIRRCIFDHLFGAQTMHAGGILGGATNWLVEDNLFYQIMSPDIPGVGANAYSPFAHAIYVTSFATNVATRGNISIKCPEGVMQRAGGICTRNVSAHTEIATNVGQAWGVTPTPGGVQALVQENLALNTYGGSFFLGNLRSSTVRSNLLLQDLDGQRPINFVLVPYNTTPTGTNIGVHNADFASNILSGTINWNPADTTSFSNLTFVGNQTNVGQTSTSIADYLSSVSWTGSTVDDWAGHLLIRDRNNSTELHYTLSVINYYRARYGLAPLE